MDETKDQQDQTTTAAGAAEQAPEGVAYYRVLPDGRAIAVTPQLLYAAIITIGRAEDKSGYDDEWMYDEDVGGFYRAMCEAAWWDPMTQEEPNGWVRTTFKAPRGQYRRRKGGEPETEYVTE